MKKSLAAAFGVDMKDSGQTQDPAQPYNGTNEWTPHHQLRLGDVSSQVRPEYRDKKIDPNAHITITDTEVWVGNNRYTRGFEGPSQNSTSSGQASSPPASNAKPVNSTNNRDSPDSLYDRTPPRTKQYVMRPESLKIPPFQDNTSMFSDPSFQYQPSVASGPSSNRFGQQSGYRSQPRQPMSPSGNRFEQQPDYRSQPGQPMSPSSNRFEQQPDYRSQPYQPISPHGQNPAYQNHDAFNSATSPPGSPPRIGYAPGYKRNEQPRLDRWSQKVSSMLRREDTGSISRYVRETDRREVDRGGRYTANTEEDMYSERGRSQTREQEPGLLDRMRSLSRSTLRSRSRSRAKTTTTAPQPSRYNPNSVMAAEETRRMFRDNAAKTEADWAAEAAQQQQVISSQAETPHGHQQIDSWYGKESNDCRSNSGNKKSMTEKMARIGSWSKDKLQRLGSKLKIDSTPKLKISGPILTEEQRIKYEQRAAQMNAQAVSRRPSNVSMRSIRSLPLFRSRPQPTGSVRSSPNVGKTSSPISRSSPQHYATAGTRTHSQTLQRVEYPKEKSLVSTMFERKETSISSPPVTQASPSSSRQFNAPIKQKSPRESTITRLEDFIDRDDSQSARILSPRSVRHAPIPPRSNNQYDRGIEPRIKQMPSPVSPSRRDFPAQPGPSSPYTRGAVQNHNIPANGAFRVNISRFDGDELSLIASSESSGSSKGETFIFNDQE